LSLANNKLLNDELFEFLMEENEGKLEHLNVSGSEISDLSLLAIRVLNKVGKLRSLEIGDLIRISKEGLENM
tara:strand:+ start:67 stop:282 length:216 start_codon:yes stop_codon:yes gene_type:complete